MKLRLLLFAGALVAGCNSHSQNSTGSPAESASTGQDGGTMTNGPNSKPAKARSPTPRGVDDYPEGKDVALSWSSKQTPNGIAIHYTVKSLSDADIWVLDRLWWSDGREDTEGAYRFERAGILRLLLGAAPGFRHYSHNVPYARLLRARGTLEGDFTMRTPVSEYSVYATSPFQPPSPTGWENKHVERVTLMLQYVLAGPDIGAEKSRLIPGALRLGPWALPNAKVALSEMPLALEVSRVTGPFRRPNLPGEPDQEAPPGTPAWEPEPRPSQSAPKHPAFGDVEKYVDVMVRYQDGYPDRSTALAETGLTAGGFVELRDHWCARFATGPGAADLRAQYEKIYPPALAARNAASRAARDAKSAAQDADRDVARAAAKVAAAASALAASAKTVPSPPPATTDMDNTAQVHLLPTFLQAPAPADDSRAPKGTAPSLLPTQSGPASMGETLELDPAAILAALSEKMPFDPRRPSAASVPSAVPSKGREQSGQTLDLDPTALGALAAAAIAKGPPRGTPGAPAAATGTPAPAATPPRKRLVRFDPQTGTPLATPYWEDLPSTSDASTRKR